MFSFISSLNSKNLINDFLNDKIKEAQDEEQKKKEVEKQMAEKEQGDASEGSMDIYSDEEQMYSNDSKKSENDASRGIEILQRSQPQILNESHRSITSAILSGNDSYRINQKLLQNASKLRLNGI